MSYTTLEESSSEFANNNNHRDSLSKFQSSTKSGEMYTLRGMKGWKKMWFILRGDLLVVFKDKTDATVHKEIDLESAKVEEDLKVKRLYTIHIETANPKKKHYCISCNTKLELSEWITALQAAAGPFVTGTSSKPVESMEAMPDVPDFKEARKQKRNTAKF